MQAGRLRYQGCGTTALPRPISVSNSVIESPVPYLIRNRAAFATRFEIQSLWVLTYLMVKLCNSTGTGGPAHSTLQNNSPSSAALLK